ncbi:MAG: MlaD family protein [Bdellovibrionales bacterium]
MKFFFMKQVVVGTILLVGISVFIALTIIIGNSDGTFLKSPNIYKSVYNEVRGIYVGSEVTIHGTRTGNVIHMKLLKDGKIEVAFTIKKDHVFMINESSTAQLKTQGALGDRYINIATKDLSAAPLAAGKYLPTAPSLDILSLISGGEKNKKSLESLVGGLDQFMQNLNEGDGILSPSNRRDISTILRTLRRIAQKVDSGEGSLGALINNKRAYNRLLILLGERPKNYLNDLSNKSKNKKKKKK